MFLSLCLGCLVVYGTRVFRGSQSLKRVLCEDETQEMCFVSKGKGHPLSCLSSLSGPAETGKSVSEEGMARQPDRRTGRPQVTFSPFLLL